MFPTGELDYQLILLPAKDARSMARWGRAVADYAAFFPNVQVARDPAQVDWRGYAHVTLVRPASFSPDLPLFIRQANPRVTLDRIAVDTPETLAFVLQTRVAYGWRYGPQTAFDWQKLWPRGVALAGLHGRADGELQPADLPLFAAAGMEAAKLTSHATLESVRALRAINPNMFIMVRPFVSFINADGSPRTITPQQFFDWTVDDVARLYDNDPNIRYLEIHNEPNLAIEGMGHMWQNGREFGTWLTEVFALYRARFPEARLGFPGLSPGPVSRQAGRFAHFAPFLEEARDAANLADWIGTHAYWVNEREMTDDLEGFSIARYREWFPDKLLFVTEFGNPAQPKAEVAAQYARYYAMHRNYPGVGGVFAYIVSTSNPVESPRWAWRDEAGSDMGVAGELGRRLRTITTPVAADRP